jgi:hypothetical protein
MSYLEIWRAAILFLDNNRVSIVTSLLSSAIALTIGTAWMRGKHFINDGRFRKNQGAYIAYKKYDDARTNPIFYLNIQSKANSLIICGYDIAENQKIEGKIYFGRNLPNYGTGYYTHGNAWGFFQVQRKSDDIIFAHMPYQDGGSQVHQAYVFVKTCASNRLKNSSESPNLPKQSV